MLKVKRLRLDRFLDLLDGGACTMVSELVLTDAKLLPVVVGAAIVGILLYRCWELLLRGESVDGKCA